MNETDDDIDIELWKTFLEKTMKTSLNMDIFIALVMVVIFIVSIIGNSVTCLVIYYDRTMHTATNFYLLNLSLSDLIVTFGIPMELYYYFHNWRAYIFSPLECKIHWFFVVLLWNNSILTMTTLAVERYVAIWYPLVLSTRPTWKRVLKIIIFLWIVAVTETLAEIMTVDLITTKNLNTCYMVPTRRSRIIFGILAFLTFILPSAIMISVYAMIIVKVNKKRDTKPDKVFNYPRNRSKVNKLIGM
ncbi:Pyrokinin-1 receptor [Eumeta japonica]|uniref:Pyrokinin-1 receptor n=1 Tax=Eumeta variegata TaxID=151549 RepID=A0A4C1YKA1_EUMVA|nr:Pyrokinin-1 receptor [Eumeta japonica]